MPRYDLIAIDLDGTLLCPRGQVSEANIRAIERSKKAGVRVTVCTGRGFNECKHLTARIGQTEPVVVAGGAMLADPHTGRTIHTFPMRHALVRRLVETLTRHGHAALVLKDPCAVQASGLEPGHDYLIV